MGYVTAPGTALTIRLAQRASTQIGWYAPRRNYALTSRWHSMIICKKNFSARTPGCPCAYEKLRHARENISGVQVACTRSHARRRARAPPENGGGTRTALHAKKISKQSKHCRAQLPHAPRERLSLTKTVLDTGRFVSYQHLGTAPHIMTAASHAAAIEAPRSWSECCHQPHAQ